MSTAVAIFDSVVVSNWLGHYLMHEKGCVVVVNQSGG